MIARKCLNERLPSRWIGKRDPIEWAARSTPLYFFLWGYVKHKVYKDNIKNLDDLREKITTTIISIKTDVLNRVFSEISKRLVLVIDKNGRHVEQLN